MVPAGGQPGPATSLSLPGRPHRRPAARLGPMLQGGDGDSHLN